MLSLSLKHVRLISIYRHVGEKSGLLISPKEFFFASTIICKQHTPESLNFYHELRSFDPLPAGILSDIKYNVHI